MNALQRDTIDQLIARRDWWTAYCSLPSDDADRDRELELRIAEGLEAEKDDFPKLEARKDIYLRYGMLEKLAELIPQAAKIGALHFLLDLYEKTEQEPDPDLIRKVRALRLGKADPYGYERACEALGEQPDHEAVFERILKLFAATDPVDDLGYSLRRAQELLDMLQSYKMTKEVRHQIFVRVLNAPVITAKHMELLRFLKIPKYQQTLAAKKYFDSTLPPNLR